jgi:hypothetical protein
MSTSFEQMGSSSNAGEYREGAVARQIEHQTAKLPSDTWLWAAIGSIGISLFCQLSGRDKAANFIGHWAPTLLILGVYNKMVKLHGSDSSDEVRRAA